VFGLAEDAAAGRRRACLEIKLNLKVNTLIFIRILLFQPSLNVLVFRLFLAENIFGNIFRL